jgi:hypothetical protein
MSTHPISGINKFSFQYVQVQVKVQVRVPIQVRIQVQVHVRVNLISIKHNVRLFSLYLNHQIVKERFSSF